MTSRSPGGYHGWVTIEGYPAGPNGRPAMQGYIEATLARAGALDLRMERKSPPDNDEDTYSWKLSWK
jgi:hypothetical protein